MGDALIANYDKYSEVREGPMTLVQGDLRLDNILFTDKNDRAILWIGKLQQWAFLLMMSIMYFY